MSVLKMGNTNSQSIAQQLEVLDLETNDKTLYSSIREAARALNCRDTTIHHHIKSNSKYPYRGRYSFERVLKKKDN